MPNPMEDKIFNSVERLDLAPMTQPAKKESTITPIMKKTRNPTTAGLSMALLPNSTGKQKQNVLQQKNFS